MNARRARRVVLLGGSAALIACGNSGKGSPVGVIPADTPSCGSTKAVLNTIPLASSAISGWVPLGNLNPPAHTFPTDHQYIYLAGFGTNAAVAEIPLLSPGNVTITSVKVTHYLTSAPYDDYAVGFLACKEVWGEFGHVRTLSAALKAQIGAIDQSCNTYSPDPSLTVQQCYSKPLAVKLAGGDAMGTAAGLDLSLFDNRITPITFVSPT
ncbi:MAG: hypothetical protein DUW69_002595, partial [Verrucomicrobia bacterium]